MRSMQEQLKSLFATAGQQERQTAAVSIKHSLNNYNIGYVFYKAIYRKVKNQQLQECAEPNIFYIDKLLSDGIMGDQLAKHACPHIAGAASFELEVLYPGVYAGMGYAHGVNGSSKDIKKGFSFDFTTGLPYIPGSSLKGMLRSHFMGDKAAMDTLALMKNELSDRKLLPFDGGKSTNELKHLRQLEECLFGSENEGSSYEADGNQGCVIFFDVFPALNANAKNALMAADVITPHKRLTDNPIPIRTIKLCAGCKLRFEFWLPEKLYPYGDEFSVQREDIAELFKLLLVEWGIGAKTHTGYGNLKIL